MKTKTRNKISGLFFSLLLLGPATDSTANDQEFLSQLDKNYPAIEKLEANFTLQGRSRQSDFFYEGKLSSSHQPETGLQLQLVLTDPVFRSPLFHLQISDNRLVWRDESRNLSQSQALDEFYWPELLGPDLPFYFFAAFLSGQLPDCLKQGVIEQNRIICHEDKLEAIFYFKNHLLAKVRVAAGSDQAPVEIKFSGRASKKGNLPAEIWFSRPGTSDFLQLRFTKMRVTFLD